MKSNIYVAEKVKVGFNLRSDTYTGALGFVIPWDKQKKIWRQEKSWLGWIEDYLTEEELEAERFKEYQSARKQSERQFQNDTEFVAQNPKGIEKVYSSWYGTKHCTNEYQVNRYADAKEKLEKGLEAYYEDNDCKNYEDYEFTPRGKSNNPLLQIKEFDNTPMEGFVLNKKAGGYSSGWDHRQTVCRVYDPRGFEFEITIDNLLYILEHTNSIVGKGLEGKFFYGWDSKRLVLLPENCPENTSVQVYTKLQETNVSLKDLVIGKQYLTKANNVTTYLGKYPIWASFYERGTNRSKVVSKKKFVFLEGTNFDFRGTCNHLSIENSPEVVPNLEELLEKLKHHSEIYLIDKSKTVYEPIERDKVKDYMEKNPRHYYDLHTKEDGEFIRASTWDLRNRPKTYLTNNEFFIRKQFLTNGKKHKEGSEYYTSQV